MKDSEFIIDGEPVDWSPYYTRPYRTALCSNCWICRTRLWFARRRGRLYDVRHGERRA